METRVVATTANALDIARDGMQRVLLEAAGTSAVGTARGAVQERLVLDAIVVRRDGGFAVVQVRRGACRVGRARALALAAAPESAFEEGREGRHARAQDADRVFGEMPEEDARGVPG